MTATELRILRIEAEAEIHLLRLKKQPETTAQKPKNKPSGSSKAVIIDMDVNNIFTDEKRFQNRFNAFSEDSKNRIIRAVESGTFDWAKFDPIIVWRDPEKQKFFVLSGHSRLAAFKELAKTMLEFAEIPVKIFKGTEEQAVETALMSNTLATKETDVERAVYWENRRKRCEIKKGISGLGALFNECERQIEQEVKDAEGKNANYILNLSYLNPTGLVIDSLNRLGVERDNESTNTLRTIANWIGEARRFNKEISDMQETEIAQFLLNGGYGNKAGQFKNKATFNERLKYSFDKWKAAGADPNRPLNLANTLSKSSFEQEYDARLEQAKLELAEATGEHEEKYNKYLQALIEGTIDQARMDELMKPLVFAVKRASDEVNRIREQKGDVMQAARSQTALFGIAEKLTWKKYADMHYLYFYVNGKKFILIQLHEGTADNYIVFSRLKKYKENEIVGSVKTFKNEVENYLNSNSFLKIYRNKTQLERFDYAQIKLELQQDFEQRQQSLFGLFYGLELDSSEQGEFLGEITNKSDVYDYLTNLVIEMIEKKPLFWRKTWKTKKVGDAYNFISKKQYSGVNDFMLNYIAPLIYEEAGYTEFSDVYMTFKQVKEKKGTIRKGAKSMPVYYYNFLYLQEVNGKEIKITEGDYKFLKNQDKNRQDLRVIPYLKYYSVFNAVDIEGINFPEEKQIEKTEREQIESCEFILNSFVDKPQIKLSTQGSAFYSPSGDYISVPKIDFFDNEQEYYSTLFHELAHSTGHSSRLSRNLNGTKGSKEYAFEELVAEFTALFLCADAGIAYFTLENSAAYIKGWNSKVAELLKADNKAIFRAAAEAQKAKDYILGGKSMEDFTPDFTPKPVAVNKPPDASLQKRIRIAEVEAEARLRMLKLYENLGDVQTNIISVENEYKSKAH